MRGYIKTSITKEYPKPKSFVPVEFICGTILSMEWGGVLLGKPGSTGGWGCTLETYSKYINLRERTIKYWYKHKRMRILKYIKK